MFQILSPLNSGTSAKSNSNIHTSSFPTHGTNTTTSQSQTSLLTNNLNTSSSNKHNSQQSSQVYSLPSKQQYQQPSYHLHSNPQQQQPSSSSISCINNNYHNQIHQAPLSTKSPPLQSPSPFFRQYEDSSARILLTSDEHMPYIPTERPIIIDSTAASSKLNQKRQQQQQKQVHPAVQLHSKYDEQDNSNNNNNTTNPTTNSTAMQPTASSSQQSSTSKLTPHHGTSKSLDQVMLAKLGEAQSPYQTNSNQSNGKVPSIIVQNNSTITNANNNINQAQNSNLNNINSQQYSQKQQQQHHHQHHPSLQFNPQSSQQPSSQFHSQSNVLKQTNRGQSASQTSAQSCSYFIPTNASSNQNQLGISSPNPKQFLNQIQSPTGGSLKGVPSSYYYNNTSSSNNNNNMNTVQNSAAAPTGFFDFPSNVFDNRTLLDSIENRRKVQYQHQNTTKHQQQESSATVATTATTMTSSTSTKRAASSMTNLDNIQSHPKHSIQTSNNNNNNNNVNVQSESTKNLSSNGNLINYNIPLQSENPKRTSKHQKGCSWGGQGEFQNNQNTKTQQMKENLRNTPNTPTSNHFTPHAFITSNNNNNNNNNYHNNQSNTSTNNNNSTKYARIMESKDFLLDPACIITGFSKSQSSGGTATTTATATTTTTTKPHQATLLNSSNTNKLTSINTNSTNSSNWLEKVMRPSHLQQLQNIQQTNSFAQQLKFNSATEVSMIIKGNSNDDFEDDNNNLRSFIHENEYATLLASEEPYSFPQKTHNQQTVSSNQPIPIPPVQSSSTAGVLADLDASRSFDLDTLPNEVPVDYSKVEDVSLILSQKDLLFERKQQCEETTPSTTATTSNRVTCGAPSSSSASSPLGKDSGVTLLIKKLRCRIREVEDENRELKSVISAFDMKLAAREAEYHLEINNIIVSSKERIESIKRSMEEMEQSYKDRIAALVKESNSKKLTFNSSPKASSSTVQLTTVTNNENPSSFGSTEEVANHKDTQKLVECLTNMIVNFAPEGCVVETKPSVKQIWKWLKCVLSEYMSLKTTEDASGKIVERLISLFELKKSEEIIPKCELIVQEHAVAMRIIRGFGPYFGGTTSPDNQIQNQTQTSTNNNNNNNNNLNSMQALTTTSILSPIQELEKFFNGKLKRPLV